MKEIIKGQAGRVAGEVDLVLAALRVAKTLARWQNAKEWEVISRPTPDFVSRLKDDDKKTVLNKFIEMILIKNEDSTLETAIIQVRKALFYNENSHPKGLPSILLGRLPRELVDVLILFSIKMGTKKIWSGNDCEMLCAFVLHWLLFSKNDSKMALRAFQHVSSQTNWVFDKDFIVKLIGEYEKEGIVRFAPREESLLKKLEEEVKKGGHKLRSWAERFTAADQDGEQNFGEALRVISTNREQVMRALMWLQRAYISEDFSSYDPTSDRDEDLPIDLDHIIPHDVFGFHWSDRCKRLEKDIITDNFRWQRNTVGNSLGNYRWLAASINRSRQNNLYKPLPVGSDLVDNHEEWNIIIKKGREKKPLSQDDIKKFQCLIDLRTLNLYKELLEIIKEILP